MITIFKHRPLLYKFERGEKVIIFNPYNLRKIFTTRKNLQKDFKKQAKVLQKHFLKPSPPILNKIRVEVTFACNLKCKYCLVYNNNLKNINQQMSLKTAKQIINFFEKNVIKTGSVMLIGGEPLVNWPVVKYFVENCRARFSLFTNGTLIDKKKAQFLAKYDVFVLLSLDGQRDFNKKRKFPNGKESFSKVIEGLKILKKYNCKVGIFCVATNNNVKHLEQIFNFFVDKLKARRVGISFPHYTLSKSKETEIDMREYTKQIKKIFIKAKKGGIYVDQLAKRFNPLLEEKFRFLACKSAGEQITFYPDGEKTLCAKLDKLPKRAYLSFLQKRLPVNNPRCKECLAIGVCGGGCFWDGEIRYKGIDKRECYLNQKLVEFFLWDLYKSCLELGKKKFKTVYKDMLTK